MVYEPHRLWQDVQGENLLEAFYKDPKRWAYIFQTYAFLTRIKAHEEHTKINSNPFQIVERSVYSDRYCFAQNAYELGLMTQLEWNMYLEWSNWLIETRVTPPSGFIYLQTDPSICYARLVKRDRHEEAEVSLEYLEALHQKHESAFVLKQACLPDITNVPVLILKCNEDFEENKNLQKEYMRQIVEFLDAHYAIPYKVSAKSELMI